MSCKTYTFSRRDKNRYRKVYRYLRKKPKYEFVSDGQFTIVVGEAVFDSGTSPEATSGPVTVTFTDCDPSAVFLTAPVVTAVAVDAYDNDSANVNVFVTSVTTTAAVFETSAPFYGTVHFQIIGRD